MDFLPFDAVVPEDVAPDANNLLAEIPKELDIFYRDEKEFLPEGKTFEDLTEEEMEALRLKYRFSPLRPGIYQTLTGMRSCY